MQIQEPIIIDIDIKKKAYYANEHTVTSNDSNTFKINVLDNEVAVDLSSVTLATLAHTRVDRKVVVTKGSVVEPNQVVFELGTTETSVAGRVEAVVQLYNADGRVSTLAFTYMVKRDPTGSTYLPSEDDKTLIEIVIGEGPLIIEAAKKAMVEELGRVESEKVRVSNELARGLNEDEREESETIREINEDVRKSNETTRIDNESVRVTSENERIAYERTRQESENQRGQNESKRATDTATAIKNAQDATGLTNNAITEANKITSENKTNYLQAVATIALRNSTYPNPKHGDTVRVTDMVPPTTFRYSNGSWVVTDTYNPTAIDEVKSQIAIVDAKLIDTARQTTTLGTGTAVVNASVDTLADVEIEGRTLTSLGNSNLEAGKKYVLADKKTKLVIPNATTYDGTTISGVAKFTKSNDKVATANYVGKVVGSNVANPHVALLRNSATLNVPTVGSEVNVGFYNSLVVLSNSVVPYSTVTNGAMSQALFSFDVIAEIERKLGIIPRTTVAEKVAWAKENVETIAFNWHGFGSSVGGNKASIVPWINGSSWYTIATTTTSSIVSKLQFYLNTQHIDTNGFTHYLAYAEPSDGVVPSTINTDYVELVVTLKATAQLNTRPRIIRVENFEGKVSGSTAENPHVIKYYNGGTAIINPPSSNLYTETNQIRYTETSKLDNISYPIIALGIAQQLFSFNIIEAVERNIGRIPRTNIADKIAWLKANIGRFSANWYGFGSSVGGSKATFSIFRISDGAWGTTVPHTNGVVTKSNISTTNIPYGLDTNGFVHFLAYAEPSDGVTPSSINTDYIDLEIELKADADFTQPKVALYEVDDVSYNKILVDWNESEVLSRFPIVEGTQHLQGIGVIAEGENLLPPFTEWTLHANAKVVSPYELEVTPTSSAQVSRYILEILPNTDYYFGSQTNTLNNYIDISWLDKDRNTISFVTSGVRRSPVNAKYVDVRATNTALGMTTFVHKNPMLTLGSVAKPFVPRNPSSVIADVKLGAIGNVRDLLYKQDGRWLLRESVRKDVVLDGSITWLNRDSSVGYKRVSTDSYKPSMGRNDLATSTKYDGKLLSIISGSTPPSASDQVKFSSSYADQLYFTISNTDSGFVDGFTPTTNDWKRQFNGWKYTDGVTWTSVTGNGQTATGQVALDTKPTDYTPYKLSYILATPQIVDVTDKVEGALKLGGATQVEVTSGYVNREKATVVFSVDAYYINNESNFPQTKLKNKPKQILKVFRNGVADNKWVIYSQPTQGYGGIQIKIPQADFDPKAEYTVTYLALDKPKLTANPTNVKLTYANSVRNALDDTVTQVEDNTTQLSVHEMMMYRMWVEIQSLKAVK